MLILPKKMQPDNPRAAALSIYPDKKMYEPKNVVSDNEPIVGASAISFFSGIKSKYNNTIKAFNDFKRHATSTEGKIKFGTMFGGFAGGCIMAYRSPSKRLWYKRMIPVATLSLTASVCYPHKALAVAKCASNGIVTSYHVSKVVLSYCYGKLQKLNMKKDNNVADLPYIHYDEEVEYTINEKGMLEQRENSKSKSVEKPAPKPAEKALEPEQQQYTVYETPEKETVHLKQQLKENGKTPQAENVSYTPPKTFAENDEGLILSSGQSLPPKVHKYSMYSDPQFKNKPSDGKKLIGDAGQGLPDEKDLYTTR